MITTQSDAFGDEGHTEHPSKKTRLASSDDDESDNDPQLTGAASSSKYTKQGGVMSLVASLMTR
jgi:hypothetical protein